MRFPLIAVRLAALVSALSCVWLLVGWVASDPASEAWGSIRGRPPNGGWTFERLVIDTLGSLALIAAAGFVVTTVLIVGRELLVAAVPSVADRVPAVGPPSWRRLVLAACGLTIAIPTLALPAVATDHPGIAPCPASCGAASLGGLSLPDLPLSDVSPDRHPLSLRATTTVRRGDSLWTIAERLVGRQATDAQISALTHALYAENRTLIGADPDLVYPGTTLTLPGGNDDRGR